MQIAEIGMKLRGAGYTARIGEIVENNFSEDFGCFRDRIPAGYQCNEKNNMSREVPRPFQSSASR